MIRNRILRHIILLLLSPVLMTLGACSSLIYDYGDDPEAPDELDTDMILKLNVDARQMISSRADKGSSPDRYEPSAGDFEQINTLRIIILRPGDDGNLIVEGNRQIATLPDGSIEPYRQQYLEFKVKGNQMKTIYLIANEASIPAPNDATKSCSQWLNETFAYAATVDPADNPLDSWTVAMPATPEGEATIGMYHDKAGNLLPLTEVFQLYVAVDQSDGASEYHVQESSLFLTRAAAKATFEFDLKDYEGSGINVTGIRFSGFDNSQYVFPHDTKYSPKKYAGDTPGTINNVTFADPETEGRFITSFDIPITAVVNPDYISGNLSIELKAAPDGPIWGPIYFPESKTATADGRYKVSVQLDDDEWLEAQPLVDNILSIGGFDAISRNTHLRIIIKFSEVGITWNAIVAPYNIVKLEPVFGLTVTEQTPGNES